MAYFEELTSWSLAKKLTVKIYELMQDNRDFGFRDQIQRAAVSIMNNIAEGVHTLTFTVTDLMGLRATRTITFAVGQKGVSTMTADKLPVYGGETVNFDVESTLHGNPEYVVRVTDAVGKLVWKTTTSSFPVAWNLTDLNGNKVPAGMYRYYGTYVDGQVHGGTPIKELIVLDPVKTANR